MLRLCEIDYLFVPACLHRDWLSRLFQTRKRTS